MKKRKLKTFTKAIILIFTLVITIILLVTSKKETKLETLFYEEKSNLDYKVCLKENNFYDEPCQRKGMSYIASAIDYIDIDFNYNFKMNKNVDYEYEYYIEGTIIISEKGNPKKILLEKPVELLKSKTNTINSRDVFAIIENLKINYDEYNTLVNSFRANYSVNIDSSLKIILKINTNSKYEKFNNPIKTTSEMEISIPLTESTVYVSMNYKEANSSDKITKNSNELDINYFNLTLSAISALISGYLIITIIANKVRDYNNMSPYEKYIKRILKNYDRWIITAIASKTDKIEEEDYDKIIDVESFQELIDEADRAGKTILWTEIKHSDKLTVSWFTIEDGKRLYRKIYNSTDTELK